MSKNPGTLAEAGGYNCHNNTAPRKSSYLPHVRSEAINNTSSLMVPNEIQTDWATEIKAPDGTIANCGHIRSGEDSGCDGCNHQRVKP